MVCQILQNHDTPYCLGFVIDGPPCMKGGRGECEFNYPKDFQNHTTYNENAMPRYRRRSKANGGNTAKVYCRYKKEEVTIDNRNVVPHNRYLLRKYKGGVFV